MLKSSISLMSSVSNKKILVVTEGVKDEPRVIKRLAEIYGLSSNVEIVTYGTNIHRMMHALEKEENLEDIDIQLLLCEVERMNSEESSEIEKLYDSYTDKIFIFDLEYQDPYYDASKLLRFIEAMNDSTGDMGKLFINYPMWESYYFSDSEPQYFLADFKKGEFKRRAHQCREWLLYNKDKLDDDGYKKLLNAQVSRYARELGRQYDAESGVELFEKQAENIKKNQIALINSSVLFFIDYLGREKVLGK